jgi:hypothetical protein
MPLPRGAGGSRTQEGVGAKFENAQEQRTSAPAWRAHPAHPAARPPPPCSLPACAGSQKVPWAGAYEARGTHQRTALRRRPCCPGKQAHAMSHHPPPHTHTHTHTHTHLGPHHPHDNHATRHSLRTGAAGVEGHVRITFHALHQQRQFVDNRARGAGSNERVRGYWSRLQRSAHFLHASPHPPPDQAPADCVAMNAARAEPPPQPRPRTPPHPATAIQDRLAVAL